MIPLNEWDIYQDLHVKVAKIAAWLEGLDDDALTEQYKQDCSTLVLEREDNPVYDLRTAWRLLAELPRHQHYNYPQLSPCQSEDGRGNAAAVRGLWWDESWNANRLITVRAATPQRAIVIMWLLQQPRWGAYLRLEQPSA